LAVAGVGVVGGAEILCGCYGCKDGEEEGGEVHLDEERPGWSKVNFRCETAQELCYKVCILA